MSNVMLSVETYSGYKADERPLSFTLGDHRFTINEVIDRWLGTDDAYFKVMADDGNRYVLRHDLDLDTWDMVMMESREAVDF